MARIINYSYDKGTILNIIQSIFLVFYWVRVTFGKNFFSIFYGVESA